MLYAELKTRGQFHNSACKDLNLDRFIKKPLCYKNCSHSNYAANIFFFSTDNFGDARHLVYKKLILFVYIVIIIYLFFGKNFGKLCPIKLKIDILYHMSNAFDSQFFRYLSLSLNYNCICPL